jgi:beta-1,2-mannobiose phosphorylase / 1,2-beta-oligomannan phosphorylase
MLIRSDKNPLLSPDKNNLWESRAVFNGSVVEKDGKFHLIYRAESEKQKQHGVEMVVSSIGSATGDSPDSFSDRKQLIAPEYAWEAFGCEDPRVTKLNGKYYIFYTALSTYPFSPAGIKVGVAVSDDLKTIKEKHLVTHFNSKAMALFPEKINGKMVALLTVNTDLPPAKIALAHFDDESEMWSPEYWHKWLEKVDDHTIPLLRSPDDHLEVGAAPVKTDQGWLVIYSYIKNYLKPEERSFSIEAFLLDLKDPSKVIARIEKPLLDPQKKYEVKGSVPQIVFPSGALIKDEELLVYYGAADTACCLAKIKVKDLLDQMQTKKQSSIGSSHDPLGNLIRFDGNPTISPIPEFPWEAKATFNPAAVYEQGKVHLVYRAMSNDNTSVMGYASSKDGFNIDERLNKPIYIPSEDFEQKINAGGNSGCEDPRLTKIDNKIYMCYTAYNGVNPPRIALTSIAVDDFVNHKWDWEKPILISPPGIDDKDGCIMSKKIGGQYVVFHRMENNICVDLVDDLNFGENKCLKLNNLIEPR